ncbi:MAG TPA: exodeoxyribonuclease V subunit gamma, partial [Pseudomonadales bacterium]|nr:exodeoxyribonuclease V subunit gamma [Pseudomonadales bacterium]
MMLHCIYSNDIRLLNRFLVNTLQDQPLTDPFLAEQIVVPGIGLSQWLKLELAKELGVAAQIAYPMPANFLWRLFHNVLETVPKESDFNKEVLHWHIYAVLPALLEKPEFQALKHYLEQGQQQGSALHAYQLAARVADVFDQYLVYRIDWINDWSAGGSLGADQQAWQPILWRAVCERIKELGREPLHRAGLFVDFIEALKKTTIKSGVFAQIPPRLFFFGFSALPPIYLAVLEELAKHRDIYLLVLNPCRYFWSETDYSTRSSVNEAGQQTAVEHALLASYGKQARGFLSQLQQMAMVEKEFYLDPSGNSLLSTVQKDLLEGKDRSADSIKAENSQHKIAVNKNDFSLSFHSHYSPLREVEALHNHLLYLFESDSTLTAGDVVVMVPAIDRYSPYIHAVFNYEKKIPFSVADRSAANEEPLLKFLLSLLQLPSSRLTASEVQEWLALPALQRRFQLDEN